MKSRMKSNGAMPSPMSKANSPLRYSKYKAKPHIIDGYRFDSKKEAQRYSELKLLEYAGEISHLIVHPSFIIEINKVTICCYEADFRYLELGKPIVEDVKGYKTPVYKLKKKLMKAL